MKVHEYGSDFHLPVPSEFLLDAADTPFFHGTNFSFYASGRAALFHLLDHGIKSLGWTDVYLPSYYCHDVSRFIQPLPIMIHFYDCVPGFKGPLGSGYIKDSKTSVLVLNSCFGMALPQHDDFSQLTIVEDITHHLEGLIDCESDFTFGSLRKELPMPMGGFVYTKKTNTLNEIPVTAGAMDLCNHRMEAMIKKGSFLEGNSKDKSSYRNLFLTTELNFEMAEIRGGLPRTAMEILSTLNVEAILARKQRNLSLMLKNLNNHDAFKVLTADGRATPFGLTLHFSVKEKRDAFKAYAVQNNLYPAILWPDQVDQKDKEWEDGLLFVHVDYRYDDQDILAMASLINNFDLNG